ACRDGYGARVTVDLGNGKLIREHRCGDGWSTQNSATMIIGVGAHTNVPSVKVKWPSGKTESTSAIPEGTLLTVYENSTDSSSREAFTRQPYRIKRPASPATTMIQGPIFSVRTADAAAKPAR